MNITMSDSNFNSLKIILNSLKNQQKTVNQKYYQTSIKVSVTSKNNHKIN